MTGLPVSVLGWGTAVPERRLTNADLEASVDTNDAWIVERTGIRERRIAAPTETASTLGTAAAADAIKRAGLSPPDIDLLVLATASPDTLLPHTAAFVGDALGLRCGSFDLSAACAGKTMAASAAAMNHLIDECMSFLRQNLCAPCAPRVRMY